MLVYLREELSFFINNNSQFITKAEDLYHTFMYLTTKHVINISKTDSNSIDSWNNNVKNPVINSIKTVRKFIIKIFIQIKL